MSRGRSIGMLVLLATGLVVLAAAATLGVHRYMLSMLAPDSERAPGEANSPRAFERDRRGVDVSRSQARMAEATGFDSTAMADGDWSSIHLAITRGDTAELRRLLADGADPNIRDIVRQTPLHRVVYAGWTDAVRILLEAGADPLNQNGEGDFILRQTRYVIDLDARASIRQLLLDAAPAYITVRRDETALFPVARFSSPDAVRRWLESELDIHHTNSIGQTALHRASAAATAILLDAGADPNATSNDGMTPLQWATVEGDTAKVEILLAAGAETAPPANSDSSALLTARRYIDMNCVSGGPLLEILQLLETAERKHK